MKIIPAAHELIYNMRAFFQPNYPKRNYINEEPLRAELYSIEQMNHLAATLAVSHKPSTRPAKDHLLKRLDDNENILHAVRKLLTDSIKKKYLITPAGEWLIDNFYLIEEHIRNARIHFPKDYSEGLPQLASGSSTGLTRIYDIVLQIISHTDGRIDADNLSCFIVAYQKVASLKLGELWAIPIMLQLGLIENLRRVASRIAIDRVDRNLAEYWSSEMIETVDKNSKDLILVIADMARSGPPMSSAFVSELTRQLHGRGPDLAMALNWIEQQLSETGLTTAELVNAEIQKQAADQVSMSNSIGSLRFINTMDWRDFVEAHSVVEKVLQEDYGGIYSSMDFLTRDRYRHVVEDIAKKSRKTEEEVAMIAIGLARESLTREASDSRKGHVGYYLVDDGEQLTRKTANTQSPASDKIRNFFKRHAFTIYFSSILAITVIVTAYLTIEASKDTNNVWIVVVFEVISLLGASELAISIVNFFSTLWVKPHLLPRMDFSNAIPPEFRTLVVVPAMLNSEEEIDEIVESLEVRFLANRNKHLHFGLLTDFNDADCEILPEDQHLIDHVRRKIIALNKKYNQPNDELFFLFHRPRCWNPRENAWMGYERKRGKITHLNSLLRGEGKENFSVIIGDPSIFPMIKYVITLDVDTDLPLACAWKLVGTMAHPLNRPLYSKKKRRVIKGYGIIQPRISASLPDKNSSLFIRMHGNEPGIDLYTKASSDVYQDLFHEGSYIGKGIYDVDIFKEALEGKFSENRILSHDLLEGCYVRAGLLSDVHLFEKYPSTYRADIRRRSRWIRGDWQILPWFLPMVPTASMHWFKNPLSTLSRWKVLDNLRRSLVSAGLTGMLLLGWIALSSPIYWTVAISLLIVLPTIIKLMWDTINKPKDVVLIHHFRNSIYKGGDIFLKTLFTLICLPYEGFVNMVAILRSLWRITISRKKLLEWNPSANEEQVSRGSLVSSYLYMWIEPLLTMLVAVLLLTDFPEKLAIATPILLLWLLAPAVTWKISRPVANQASSLTERQYIFLHKMSRKIWAFFECFVTVRDNWLPPDNFQEQPTVQLAHRTSPTNIGLYLLASISACDFGYVSVWELHERMAQTLDTLGRMDRYKRHFYNWYDTETLSPLFPNYISTVDSGNLIAHLMVASRGMHAIPCKKLSRSFGGFRDTASVLADALNQEEAAIFAPSMAYISELGDEGQLTIQAMEIQLETLAKDLPPILEQLRNEPDSETYWWKKRLLVQLDQLKAGFKVYEPWLLLAHAPPIFAGMAPSVTDWSPEELLTAIRELEYQVNQYAAEVTPMENDWLISFRASLSNTTKHVENLIAESIRLAEECIRLSDADWNFLYNKTNHLFTIGYNAQEHRADPSSYDLLASEARLSTFICIAQGKLPEQSWFALGRQLTNINKNTVLLSWSGSMFEYLMPLLVMPSYENTLLDQTYKGAVRWQIQYGRQVGLPWGISESGYNMVSANSNYQYRAFGAPGLGLKRGLEEDSVVAPYASALALMVVPEKACENLQLLSHNGFEGKYGLYEAIDYTPSRLPPGQSNAVVYSFMAHHQGMTLLSLAHLLLDKPMQKLFESEPQFKAALLLLQEKIPRASTFYTHTTDIADVNYVDNGKELRIINTPNTAIPEVQLLSNGSYHVMITNSGGGYSRWKNMAVTRWREDMTRDNWGTFFYIKDVDSSEYWSGTYQPTLKPSENYEVVFSQGRADFNSLSNGIKTQMEVVVSPEDDIEMRRLTVTNMSHERRTIEITSYSEVVLTHPDSDLMQPAFNNLFVQTEIFPSQQAILCTRRPRSVGEQPLWMFHLMMLQGTIPSEVSYETDRVKFIGRGNTTMNPSAMSIPGPLSGSQGSVLDPIVSVRSRIVIDTGETITIDALTGVAKNKETCAALVDKYQDKHHRDRVFELAWIHSQVILRQINASETDAQLYGSLAGSILYTNSALRAEPSILIHNHRSQSSLWGYSISGDLPIILVKIAKRDNLYFITQLIQAHAYWRLKGIAVDLVIWNEDHGGYRQVFQNEIQALVPAELSDKPGGIFVRASEQISNEDRILFETVSRINISDNGLSLADHVKRKPLGKIKIGYFKPLQLHNSLETTPVPPLSLPEGLSFFNGFGGFSPGGKEYTISVSAKSKTPAPWVNVIANPYFGTVISESGSSYTWYENAHEFRLTPWNNDPVCDGGGEAVYLRDEESGHFWSATLLPAGGSSNYIVRHGFGYSIFEYLEDGIHTEMTVYTDLQSPIKFTVLRIINKSGRTRKLSATSYTEWVLGNNRTRTGMYIHTEIDPVSGAIFAINPYSTEFSSRVAFVDVDYLKKSFTCDRTEFIGRNGSLQVPDAMLRSKLSGKSGLALDPCASLQVPFDLVDGEEYEVIFRLGTGRDKAEASAIVQQFRGTAVAEEAFEKVKKYWTSITGAVSIETPDAALNLVANGWLTYQTLSSRLWGRSGYYQSGGAFGYRDQLQDVLSLLHAAPQFAREHILLCASRQFKEGDVQHWWHPPSGRGVRTRCSDDYLWLPLVTALYVSHTGDVDILDESVRLLDGRPLNSGEDSYYDLPIVSNESLTIYEHCARAIRHGFTYGSHGLPLIGTGDWNDGFDKVGEEGRGESVWLAFFLYDILKKFTVLARLKGDMALIDECESQAKTLRDNVDLHAWDGEWYRRAWFDDGTVLGSSRNDECRIDSISQSWSVLSEAGNTTRIHMALESAYTHLVHKDAGIIQLLEPPFDKSNLNPGYIKGYVPGVRENGGQYTHAAVWLIAAFAKVGYKERVWELLNMINPVNHGKTSAEIAIYKVEPYVLAADIYARAPHTGRGGWTWYTGSASWMYMLIIESFLGIRKEDNKLKLSPCIPREWNGFKIDYRHKDTTYHITVMQQPAANGIFVTVDGVRQADNFIPLADDAREHTVLVEL